MDKNNVKIYHHTLSEVQQNKNKISSFSDFDENCITCLRYNYCNKCDKDTIDYNFIPTDKCINMTFITCKKCNGRTSYAESTLTPLIIYECDNCNYIYIVCPRCYSDDEGHLLKVLHHQNDGELKEDGNNYKIEVDHAGQNKVVYTKPTYYFDKNIFKYLDSEVISKWYCDYCNESLDLYFS